MFGKSVFYFLFHIHNLRWRFVIHGGIDGFTRMIVFLECHTNNRASTVYRLFHNAVQTYGLPSRVRSDKGRENYDVPWFMLSHPLRGPTRGSHIAGRSVHNQRIERLARFVHWVHICVLPVILPYGEVLTSRPFK